MRPSIGEGCGDEGEGIFKLSKATSKYRVKHKQNESGMQR